MPRDTPVREYMTHRRAHLRAGGQRAGRPCRRWSTGASTARRSSTRRRGGRHAHHRRPDRAGEPAPLPDGPVVPRRHPRAAVGEEAVRRGHPPGARRERGRGDVARPADGRARTTPSSGRPPSCTTTTCRACPVVRGGLLVGIIARTDIVRAIVAEPRSPRTTRAGDRAGHLGRGRPSAIAHNVAALARAASRPAELCVVVKADGYGHGAVGAARAALAAGADLPGGGAAPRRAPRCGRPASTRRCSCCPSHRPATRAAVVDARPRARRLHRGRHRRAGRRGRRRGRPAAGPPEGGHRHAPRRVPPGRRDSAGQGDRRRRPAAPRVGVDPPRGGRRARRPVHR